MHLIFLPIEIVMNMEDRARLHDGCGVSNFVVKENVQSEKFCSIGQ